MSCERAKHVRVDSARSLSWTLDSWLNIQKDAGTLSNDEDGRLSLMVGEIQCQMSAVILPS